MKRHPIFADLSCGTLLFDGAAGVIQFHSRVLARFVTSLCEGGEAEPVFLCGALNVNAANFDVARIIAGIKA